MLLLFLECRIIPIAVVEEWNGNWTNQSGNIGDAERGAAPGGKADADQTDPLHDGKEHAVPSKSQDDMEVEQRQSESVHGAEEGPTLDGKAADRDPSYTSFIEGDPPNECKDENDSDDLTEEQLLDILLQVIDRTIIQIQTGPDEMWDREQFYKANVMAWLPGALEELRDNNLTAAVTTVLHRSKQPFDSWPREQTFRRQSFLETIEGRRFTELQLSVFVVLTFHEMFISADKLPKFGNVDNNWRLFKLQF